MKKLTSMILALMLLIVGFAMAESGVAEELKWTESVAYYGDGIFVIDFMKDIPWRTQYLMTLTDAQGNPMTYTALGGDASEAVVKVDGEIEPDTLYTFTLVSANDYFYAVGRSTVGYIHANNCEYCLAFGHDERACMDRLTAGAYEIDRCDFCGELNHEDDSCPARQSGAYCDECGEYGHEDEMCVYNDHGIPLTVCTLCGRHGHGANDCAGTVQPTPLPAATGQAGSAAAVTSTPQPRQEYCDDCREYGHDDDKCPYEWCDYCGEKGHDDDRCPERTCKRCGEKGHSKDACPTKRCDECGEYGHDDDRCPNERCDECGEKGHDDDHCPHDRHGR